MTKNKIVIDHLDALRIGRRKNGEKDIYLGIRIGKFLHGSRRCRYFADVREFQIVMECFLTC